MGFFNCRRIWITLSKSTTLAQFSVKSLFLKTACVCIEPRINIVVYYLLIFLYQKFCNSFSKFTRLEIVIQSNTDKKIGILAKLFYLSYIDHM